MMIEDTRAICETERLQSEVIFEKRIIARSSLYLGLRISKKRNSLTKN
jgi:hypothetical protein